MTHHRIAWIFLLLLSAGLGGCGSYQLQGVVVDGPRSEVLLVDADDPRLEWQRLSDVSVRLVLDPDSLGRKVVGHTTTGHDGRFAFTVDEAGAGFLEYEASVIAEAEERQPVMHKFMLPRGEKRVLVMLATGRGRVPPLDDPLRDAEEQIERHFPR